MLRLETKCGTSKNENGLLFFIIVTIEQQKRAIGQVHNNEIKIIG